MIITKKDILKLVENDFKKASSTKIKVSQREYFEKGLPKVYTQCLELDETIQELEKRGYICRLSKTDKVINTKAREFGNQTKVYVAGIRKLVTTNLIISKK